MEDSDLVNYCRSMLSESPAQIGSRLGVTTGLVELWANGEKLENPKFHRLKRLVKIIRVISEQVDLSLYGDNGYFVIRSILENVRICIDPVDDEDGNSNVQNLLVMEDNVYWYPLLQLAVRIFLDDRT